jgi:hypothetical protein
LPKANESERKRERKRCRKVEVIEKKEDTKSRKKSGKIEWK